MEEKREIKTYTVFPLPFGGKAMVVHIKNDTCLFVDDEAKLGYWRMGENEINLALSKKFNLYDFNPPYTPDQKVFFFDELIDYRHQIKVFKYKNLAYPYKDKFKVVPFSDSNVSNIMKWLNIKECSIIIEDKEKGCKYVLHNTSYHLDLQGVNESDIIDIKEDIKEKKDGGPIVPSAEFYKFPEIEIVLKEDPVEIREESKKNDFKDDKLRWDLLPLEEIEDIVKVYHAGAKKYGENTWQKLPDGKNRYKAALLRHLMEYEKGNRIDEETGAFHLAQCAWNAIAMLYLDKHEHDKEKGQ